MIGKAHRLAARVGRLIVLAIGCGAVTAVPVSHSRAATDVTTFGYHLPRTGNNPAERVIGTGNVGTLSLKWSAATGRLRLLTQPLVAAGVRTAHGTRDLVYVGARSGVLIAVDRATGAVV